MDELVKDKNDNPSIGIILCQSKNDRVVDYTLKYINKPVGKNNRYGHPNKEVLNNLKESKIYRTDYDGSIMFKINDKKLKIGTCST